MQLQQHDLPETGNYAPEQPPPQPNTDNTTGTDTSPTQSKWQQRLEYLAQRVAIPLNRLAVKRGCESFVPTPMEEECAKAARIIRSFSYTPTRTDNNDTSSHIVTIPPSAFASAVGIIVFTTGRLGLSHLSGSTGSGILITRRHQQDQGASTSNTLTWNHPIAIQTHGVGYGPLAFGFDISDRVYLIRSRDTLNKLFNRGQFMVGPEVVLAALKWGGGAGLTFSGSLQEVHKSVKGAGQRWSHHCRRHRHNHPDEQGHQAQPAIEDPPKAEHHHEEHKDYHENPWQATGAPDEKPTQSTDHPAAGSSAPVETPNTTATNTPSNHQSNYPPIHCYMRSRGFYAGLQAEGTAFSERTETNAEFYGRAGAATVIPAPETGEQPPSYDWRDYESAGWRHANLGDDPAWGSGPEVRAVEGVWEALREVEFGVQEGR